MEDEKKSVLEKIMISEDDIVKKIKNFVELSHDIIKVNKVTGNVVFEDKYDLLNSDRIFLLLLGKYFAYHYGILESPQVNLKTISDELRIKRTTLPAPIKTLLKKDFISKPGGNTYEINPYKIAYVLNQIHNKHKGGKK